MKMTSDLYVLKLTNTCLHGWSPHKPERSESLSVSKKKGDVCYAVKSPGTRAVRSAGPKCPVLEVLLHHIPLEKQHTKKNKEEAEESAKLTTERTKQATEKHQDQVAKSCRVLTESFYCEVQASD